MNIRLGKTSFLVCKQCHNRFVGTHGKMQFCSIQHKFNYNLDKWTKNYTEYIHRIETKRRPGIEHMPTYLQEQIDTQGYICADPNRNEWSSMFTNQEGLHVSPSYPQEPSSYEPSAEELRIIEKLEQIGKHKEGIV